jgi:molybdopterin-biosynthesis enzyme MoeA-like protein
LKLSEDKETEKRIKDLAEKVLNNNLDILAESLLDKDNMEYYDIICNFISETFNRIINRLVENGFDEEDVFNTILKVFDDSESKITKAIKELKKEKKSKELSIDDIKEEIKTNEEVQKAIKEAFIELCDGYGFYYQFDKWVLSHMTKEELKDVNPKKAFSVLSMLRDQFSELINEWFEDADIDIILTKSIMDEVASTIDELLKNDSEIMSKLKDIIQEHANDVVESGLIAEISPYTLSKNNDKVGDIIEVDDNFSVDLGYRDAPFVFLNGNIEIGRESDTHSMLLTRLIDNEESSPKYIRGDDAFEMTGDNKLAFGHLVNGLAFLEVVDNVNVNEVVNALIDLPDINKVYDYVDTENYLERLAKLI